MEEEKHYPAVGSEKAGYLFDSSEFDKSQRYCIKKPYQVNSILPSALAKKIKPATKSNNK